MAETLFLGIVHQAKTFLSALTRSDCEVTAISKKKGPIIPDEEIAHQTVTLGRLSSFSTTMFGLSADQNGI